MVFFNCVKRFPVQSNQTFNEFRVVTLRTKCYTKGIKSFCVIVDLGSVPVPIAFLKSSQHGGWRKCKWAYGCGKFQVDLRHRNFISDQSTRPDLSLSHSKLPLIKCVWCSCCGGNFPRKFPKFRVLPLFSRPESAKTQSILFCYVSNEICSNDGSLGVNLGSAVCWPPYRPRHSITDPQTPISNNKKAETENCCNYIWSWSTGKCELLSGPAPPRFHVGTRELSSIQISCKQAHEIK